MIKHSLANYPTHFLGTVVSENKICLQFENVQSKLRFRQGAEYIKLPDTHKALPISTQGTPIDILAVGCQLPTLFDAHLALIEAYKEHHERFNDPRTLNFLLELKGAVDNAIASCKGVSPNERESELFNRKA